MLIKQVFKNLFSKPYTVKYPKERPTWVSNNFRGEIRPIANKCIGCRICERNCPSKAIKMINNNKNIEIDMAQCLFCGLCIYNCPTQAIESKPDFEHATTDRKKLKLR